MIDPLDPLTAPCKWCGYNGENYWQAGTHGASCPWHRIGGDTARRAHLTTHLSALSTPPPAPATEELLCPNCGMEYTLAAYYRQCSVEARPLPPSSARSGGA